VSLYEYQARVTKVIDGDTLALDIDLGLGIHAHLPRARLAGVDCPELPTPEGIQAANFTTRWVTELGPVFNVITVKDRRDAYGRYLVSVRTLAVDGPVLNRDLIHAGAAKPYKGVQP
jgi:micrococcal nuclease